MPTLFSFSLNNALFHFVGKHSVFIKIYVSQHSIFSNEVDLRSVSWKWVPYVSTIRYWIFALMIEAESQL